MRILVIVLSIFVAIRTLSYGIFEYKHQKNKIAGILLMIFAAICLIVPTYMSFLRR